MFKRLLTIIVLGLFIFTGCTFQKAAIQDLSVAPLSSDQYVMTKNDITSTAGGWLFFFGLLGGVSPDAAVYNAIEENSIDGLMVKGYKGYIPWYGMLLGFFTAGIVGYSEIEMKGIGYTIKR
jgi:hypothetical protein